MQKEIIQHRRAVVEQWLHSGKTQIDFAKEHQMPINRLRYWIRHQRDIELGKDCKRQQGSFVQINSDAATTHNQEIIIRYPNGVELRLSGQTQVSVLQNLIKF
jgi:transposase-like protein